MLHAGLLLLGMLAIQREDKAFIEERFRVEYVLLDVVATKKDELVTDLTQADFELKEGNTSVPITHFEILDFRNGQPVEAAPVEVPDDLEPGASVAPSKAGQQFVIAVDFESVVLGDINRAFTQLEQFLKGLGKDGTPVKLNLYALDRGSLTKGFTTEISDAISALALYRDSFKATRESGGLYDSDIPGMGGGGGPRRGNRSSGALATGVVGLSDLERALNECLQWGSGSACRCISDSVEDYMEQQRDRSERVIGELEILAYKFDDSKDLKTMLVLSPGFVLRRLSAVTKLEGLYAQSAGCGTYRDNPLGGKLDLNANFNRVVHACTKNRVTFHTFDLFNSQATQSRSMSAEYQAPSSGELGQVYRDYERQINEGLRELAEESGGTFRQAFRVEGPFNKALEENRYFYVIGYQSPQGEKGKFRKIEVKVKAKGVKLRYRKGYFGS